MQNRPMVRCPDFSSGMHHVMAPEKVYIATFLPANVAFFELMVESMA